MAFLGSLYTDATGLQMQQSMSAAAASSSSSSLLWALKRDATNCRAIAVPPSPVVG